jgi:hypothetical protein
MSLIATVVVGVGVILVSVATISSAHPEVGFGCSLKPLRVCGARRMTVYP